MAQVVLNTALYASGQNEMTLRYSLDIARLAAAYDARELTLREVLRDLLAGIEATHADNPAWIHVIARDQLRARAAALEARRAEGERLPLYGIPFAVKDNIDIAGEPTTAACPEFGYRPDASAYAVQRLEHAGALCIGKTNMDQFATGLVGTRTPYGACRNPFEPRYISGGSSSGSAVAVALGHVSFALGTDTAGSGRVPAGFCNVVGYKPTRGLVSTRGVVPACRSLDCVSVFALTADDAARVGDAIAAFDELDPYSRAQPVQPARTGPRVRFGVPRAADLRFFGDAAAQNAFERALGMLRSIGGEIVEIDFSPFAETARLLYEGPWVAERLAAIRPFFDTFAERVDPVVRGIIAGAHAFSAIDAFEAQYRLETLRRRAMQEWRRMDVLVVPTAGTIYRIDEIAAEPVQLNTNLGYYTNFVNLLDLAAVAVPGPYRSDGLPAGLTLIGPAFEDRALLAWAARLHRAANVKLGATDAALPDSDMQRAASESSVTVAVVGAHLSGMPLNDQLTSRGARLLEACTTAPHYRLYALPDTAPPKPGLARVLNGSGVAIEVELWEVPVELFGSFVAEVPPPLAIGTIALADGRQVKGFVCEDYALERAHDISRYGGWRRYMKHADE